MSAPGGSSFSNRSATTRADSILPSLVNASRRKTAFFLDDSTRTAFTSGRTTRHGMTGRAVTEIVGDYARALDRAPVCSTATPAELEALFDEPLPLEGVSVEEIFEKFRRDVLPHAMNIPSPRYYGLFNPTPLPVAVWADTVAAAINQTGAAWRHSPSAIVLEPL